MRICLLEDKLQQHEKQYWLDVPAEISKCVSDIALSNAIVIMIEAGLESLKTPLQYFPSSLGERREVSDCVIPLLGNVD